MIVLPDKDTIKNRESQFFEKKSPSQDQILARPETIYSINLRAFISDMMELTISSSDNVAQL
jgi:hypothetical protein